MYIKNSETFNKRSRNNQLVEKNEINIEVEIVNFFNKLIKGDSEPTSTTKNNKKTKIPATKTEDPKNRNAETPTPTHVQNKIKANDQKQSPIQNISHTQSINKSNSNIKKEDNYSKDTDVETISTQNTLSSNNKSSNSESISNNNENHDYELPIEGIPNVDNEEAVGNETLSRDNLSNLDNISNNSNFIPISSADNVGSVSTIGNKESSQNRLITSVILILGLYAFFVLGVGIYIHRKKANTKKMEPKKEEEALDIMSTYKFVTENDYPYPIINKHLKNVICTTLNIPTSHSSKNTKKIQNNPSIHLKSPLSDPNNVITYYASSPKKSIISDVESEINNSPDNNNDNKTLSDPNNIIISPPKKAAVSNVVSDIDVYQNNNSDIDKE